MRISTAMAQKFGVDAMLQQQAKLTYTQLQVASGKKILSPSDDVTGSNNALEINKFLAGSEQYQRNTVQLTARLNAEEIALNGATDIMERLKELSVYGNNGALSASDRVAIGQEALQLMDGMYSIANTVGPNGDYLFGGLQAQTQPFDKVLAVAGPPDIYDFPWQGNPPPASGNEQRLVDISPTRSIADGDSGIYVFGDSPVTGGGTQDIFTTIQNFANNMLNDTPAQSDIGDLDLAAARIREVHTTVGNRMNAVENQNGIIEAYNLQMKGILSDTQDLDLTEAIGRFTLQTQTLQAAQQAFSKVQGLSLFNYLR